MKSKNTMTTLEGLHAELVKLGQGQEFSIQAHNIESKISLIMHALSHGPDELDESQIDGITSILDEIQDEVASMGKYCYTAKEYHSYLENPDRLAETQEAERIAAMP